jgi:hypothetical protein
MIAKMIAAVFLTRSGALQRGQMIQRVSSRSRLAHHRLGKSVPSNVMLSGAQRPRVQEPMKHRRMQTRHRFQRVRSN